MYRFFIESIDENSEASLSKADSAHAYSVLRLAVGDEISATYNGVEFSGVIISSTRNQVRLSILGEKLVNTEPDVELTLYQCMPKFEKLEFIIQKSVELGVRYLVPVRASRCIKKLSDDEAQKKLVRFNKIAYEAAKQSHRLIVPEVLSPVDLFDIDFLSQRYDALIVAYEEERFVSLKSVLRSLKAPKRVALFIGSEGGIARDEIDFLKGQSAVTVSLGKRILRTETAAVSALSNIFYELEEKA